jgi:hypothetical protein
MGAFQQSRAKQSLIVCRLHQGGARRQNRTVPAYGLPPITVRRCALLTASLDPPRSSNGNEIAIPAVSEPKGQTMIVKKTNQPTHCVYAERKTGQDARDQRRLGQQGWQRLRPQTQPAAGRRSRVRGSSSKN